MSFLSILKKLGQVSTAVAPIAVPVVGGFNPIAGAVLSSIFKGIAAAEIPDVPGPAKKVVATNVIAVIIADMVNAQLARDGVQFHATPDQIDQVLAQMPGAIDNAVGLFNAVSGITAIIEKNLAPAPAKPAEPQALPLSPVPPGAQA